MTREEWRHISEQGLESYEVSNFGRVRNKKGKILKQRILYGGYLNCCLYKNGRIVTRRVNRLVAFAFCDGYKDGYVANHIDHDRLNNCAYNLEWCSQKENTNTELFRKHISEALLQSSKIRRKKIRQLSIDGLFLKEYTSVREAARENSIAAQNISKCCLGRIQSCGGYKWEYVI